MVPVSGRIVPAAAWSVPPEPRGRRALRRSGGRHGSRIAVGKDAHRNACQMSGIARRFGVSLAELLDYNDLTMRSVIRAGDVVRIPPR